MNLVKHPPADAKAMFTHLDPDVKAEHTRVRNRLNEMTEEENEQQRARQDSARPK